MNEHPAAATLKLFSQGGCMPPDRERVMHHLLLGCESCSSALRRMGRPARPPGDALDAALDRAFSRARQEIPARDHAFALFSRLLATPAERRLALVAEAPERVAAGLCRLLLEEVRLATNADPQRMLDLSRLAAAVADRLETAADAAERRILSDLRGEAWSHLANSLRVTGRLREAQKAFTAAERLLAAGTRVPTLRAELLRRKASLHSHQRKFEQAIALTAEAAEIFRDLGLSGDVAGCLVKQAIFTGYAGRPEEALGLLAGVLGSIPQDGDLARQAIHAAARFSLDAGRPEEGLALLVEHRQMMEKAAPVALLRLSWLHGELAHALRLYRASEIYLLEARKGFSALEMPYEVALVCLELAAVYGKTGRQEELRGLAAEMLPIFESLRVKRETLASVILLQRAEIDSALPLVGRISAQLRRRKRPFPASTELQFGAL
jgi:tetratricopeptide (TPR) repeat protein